MASQPAPDWSLDDAYWQSLLNDVESLAPDPARNGHQPAAAPRPDGSDALWQAAQRASDDDQVIRVHSTGCNRGGLLIEWNGLRGFMPASHVRGLAASLDEASRRGELAQRVGQSLNAKVIEIDRGQGRFVVSERLAGAEHSRREALLAELAAGQVRAGTLTNVCSFGAFVDLGGLEGLLHISEISWGRVTHPGDVLKVGQAVRVLVMSVDRAHNRVALSMKRLSPDPWLTVEERYAVGQIVSGVVTGVVAFGAFIRLEDGLEGLIHVSQLAEGDFMHPRNVVCEGDAVRARVLSIDGAHRRLSLSLRQLPGSGLGHDGPLG